MALMEDLKMPLNKRSHGRFLSRTVPAGLFTMERAHGEKTRQESVAMTQKWGGEDLGRWEPRQIAEVLLGRDPGPGEFSVKGNWLNGVLLQRYRYSFIYPSISIHP